MIDLFEPGDLLIERGSGIWGGGAKLLFGADHQHACLITNDRHYVIEAVWDGVKVNRISQNLERYELWRPLCSEEIRRAAVVEAFRSLEEGYGYQQLLLKLINQRFGIPVPDVPGVWCGELIARCYSRRGYDLNLMLPDHATGPWDLRNPRLVRLA